MNIFLGVFLELVTIMYSESIYVKHVLKAIPEIIEKGYRINEEVWIELIEKRASVIKTVLRMFLKLFPGVNLISAEIKGILDQKRMFRYFEENDALIPMTDKEKENYSKLRTDKERERFAVVNFKKKIMPDHDSINLLDDKLLLHDCSFEEVKRLNEFTSYQYRIGKIDGEYVAIIGIPSFMFEINQIRFESENYRTIHLYEDITEEESKGKVFTVYGYILISSYEEGLLPTINEIKQSHRDAIAQANAETMGLGYSDNLVEPESLGKSSKEVTLKRELNPKDSI
ncbi:MAG: hypothetical protein NC483_02650 [Ruminococcus sp.]|nr:hypothetical protein [Ruminococcus sp.]